MTSVPGRPVDLICDTFVDESCALDPVTATSIGVPGHDDRLTDLSPDGFDAREEHLRRTLAAARSAVPSDEREQAAKEAFLERLELTLERCDAHVPQSEVSVIVSGLHDLRMSFDLMDTASERGWHDVDARLAQVASTLAGYRRTLLEEADHGHVSAQRQYAEVATQVRHWTGQAPGQAHGRSVFGVLVDKA